MFGPKIGRPAQDVRFCFCQNSVFSRLPNEFVSPLSQQGVVLDSAKLHFSLTDSLTDSELSLITLENAFPLFNGTSAASWRCEWWVWDCVQQTSEELFCANVVSRTVWKSTLSVITKNSSVNPCGQLIQSRALNAGGWFFCSS